MVPLIWLMLGGALLLLEVLAPGFDGLLVGAMGALVVSLMSALTPIPTWLQALIFFASLLAGGVWMWRWSRQRSPSTHQLHAHEAGAVVLSPFDQQGEGRVRWHGQSWAATALGADDALVPGMRVIVMGRDGTHLQVMPEQALHEND
ncbi:NfeD family protein [Synechococcus sp. RSCCF101]|uniref:NfeD family protein n=1 Tax=Synechococcus sp. RSCCF101 TaxID=2511069 RepID=UPI0012439BDE|nr:NfeD family protein [Synechococcus sp. RSCCF101]QEY32026.1 NfeD family protein [Synechococcus sp. RSCCF101]